MTASLRPRIAIPMPTSGQMEYNARSWPFYAAAVAGAGGEPVEVSLSLPLPEMMKLMTSCQGILLPGSPADVNPAKYGQSREPETAADDPARENADELLLQEAHNLYKPLLCICYGMQSLNTWRTGTLVQHLNPVPVNHAAGRSVAIAHSVAIDPKSRLADIVQSATEAIDSPNFRLLSVNSSHHQAIGIPGDGLKVVARCPQDAVVEAVAGDNPNHFVLGVQWHPERDVDSSAASRLLFECFVRAAAGWHPRTITESIA